MAFSKTARLQKEMQRLQMRLNEAGGNEKFLTRDRWVLQPTDSMDIYDGFLYGPENTPYENQRYPIVVSLKDVNYPQSPPKVYFTKVIPFHANVFTNGNICIDILKTDLANSQWAPVMKLEDVMLSLVSMLNDPNTDSPANVDAARAYDCDKEENKPNFTKLVLAHYEKQTKKN